MALFSYQSPVMKIWPPCLRMDSRGYWYNSYPRLRIFTTVCSRLRQHRGELSRQYSCINHWRKYCNTRRRYWPEDEHLGTHSSTVSHSFRERTCQTLMRSMIDRVFLKALYEGFPRTRTRGRRLLANDSHIIA